MEYQNQKDMEYKKKEEKPIQKRENISKREHSNSLDDNRTSSLLQRKLFELNDENISNEHSIQKKEDASNNTGLPNQLKSSVEKLSGESLDDVNVHYNSSKPADLNAAAYAQGTDIHLGAGQEKHLPHETWHVVQQKQGRVKPTFQLMEDIPINDDEVLEEEADLMGDKAEGMDLE